MPGLVVPAAAGALNIAAGTAAYAALEIGVGLAFAVGGSVLGGAISSENTAQSFDLSRPDARPLKRFIYGHTLAVGTPAPIRVRGSQIIGCWILNSRPSAMTNLKVFLDKREVEYSGDPFDFSGAGGVANTDPFAGHVQFWIGAGGQVAPPTYITDNWPWGSGSDDELFKTTDGWQGRTVIWAVIDAGDADERRERWPSGEPLVEVEADFSYLYDPREIAHDPDDSDTWAYSANHSLIVLDALMQNPIRPYTAENLIISQFEDAADIADQAVALKAGGTEARYTVGGTVIWSGEEIWRLIEPLYAAGAARVINVGGRRGIAPGAYEAPSYTLTDFLGAPPKVIGSLDSDLPTRLVTTYRNPERLFEAADLEPYDIPGAQDADGGVPRVRNLDLTYAGSPTQAMRVQQIEGALARQQRSIELVAPPNAADLVGGATLTSSIAAPWDRIDGVYRVESINPAVAPLGEDGGVALRCPMVARLHSASVYDWNAASDEQDIEEVSFNEATDGVTETYLPPTLIDLYEDPTQPGRIVWSYETPNEPTIQRLVVQVFTGSYQAFNFSATPNVTYGGEYTLASGATANFVANVTGPNGSESPIIQNQITASTY